MYQINLTPVKIRQISVPMDSPLGSHYTKNIVDYKGHQYDVICNGEGDCFIYIDGKKRYLETI